MYQQNQPSLWNLFGTLVIFVAAAGYGIMSLSTEDPLWFVPTFSEEAERITLYCKGEATEFGLGSPHVSELNDHIQKALSGPKNWDSLTMSDETYSYFQSSDAMIVLEFHYATPVRVHSIYKFFSGFDSIVVPLDGRHANLNAVFARIGDNNTAGALHVQSTGETLDYLSVNGLCSP